MRSVPNLAGNGISPEPAVDWEPPAYGRFGKVFAEKPIGKIRGLRLCGICLEFELSRGATLVQRLRLNRDSLDEKRSRRLPDETGKLPSARLRNAVYRAAAGRQILQPVKRQLEPVLHSQFLE